MEWLPRISRAQSMDVLSSQATSPATRRGAGAAEIGRFFPDADDRLPNGEGLARLILGGPRGGLRRSRRPRRLGVIEASDVRPRQGTG